MFDFLFKLPQFLFDNNDEGPPAGYDPDSESTPPTPTDDQGLQDMIDFTLGKPGAAQQVSEKANNDPDGTEQYKEEEPEQLQQTQQQSPPAKPKPAEQPRQVEEVLTAEKITEYGLDPKEFKVGDKVTVTYDENEEQLQSEDPEPRPGSDPEAEREQKLLAALNGNVDIDWSEIGVQQQQPAQPETKGTSTEQPPVEQPTAPISMNFVTSEEDIARITSSTDEFNKYSADLVAKGAQIAIQRLIPAVRQLIPKAINQEFTVRDFFKDDSNKDLVPIQNYFGKAMGLIASKEPALLNDLPKLMQTTATVVRKNLGLKTNGVTKPKQKKDERPYVVRRTAQLPGNKVQGKVVTKAKPKTANDQEAQMLEMENFAINY